jgi:integrase
MIIEYLFDHLSKDHKKRTVQMAMSAIFRFCMMNDLMINKRKISMQIKPDENHTDDRAYSQGELEELVRQSTDERFRAVILLMASTGMRVGAIPDLEIRDLIPKSIGPNGEILDGDAGVEKLYQIWVYRRSPESKYYTFCTPECRQSIDKYLASRAKEGEDVSINDKNTAPLIREQFSKEDVLKPQKLSVYTFKKAIGRTIKRAGLSTKGEVAMTHGFRKFAITQMIKAKVPYEVREFVSGHRHSRGLDTSYDRLNANERLERWAPAINYLTINEELKLRKQLKVVTEGQAQEIAALQSKYDALESKYKEIDKLLGSIDNDELRRKTFDSMYQEGAAVVQDQYNESAAGGKEVGPPYNSNTYKQLKSKSKPVHVPEPKKNKKK